MNLKEFKKIYIENGFSLIEAEITACEVLNKTRTELFFETALSKKAQTKLLKILKNRKKGKPLNLILKKQNFYGRDFTCNKNVLKPRAETEIIVKTALPAIKNNCKVLDLCAGSGIIGLTIFLEKPAAKLTLSDISKKALKVCKKNALKFKVPCKIVKSNLFEKLDGKFDVIVCNPPYIKTDEIKNLQTEVKKHDPFISLNGGSDGLEFYRKIEKHLKSFLNGGGAAFFEIGFNQAKDVEKIFSSWQTEIVKDLDGNNRVLIVKEAQNA